MKRLYDRIEEIIKLGLHFATLFLLIILVIFVSLSILDRYILNFGWAWLYELSLFSFIWLIFLAAALISIKEGHFIVDSLVKKIVKPKYMVKYNAIINIFSLLILITLFLKSVKYVQIIGGQFSPALGIPMVYIYISIPICFFIMVLSFIKSLFSSLKI